MTDERKKSTKSSAQVHQGGGISRLHQGTIHPQLPPATVDEPVATTLSSVPPIVDTCRNDFDVMDDVWNRPPSISRPNDSKGRHPKAALTDMLHKKSRLPHEAPELFIDGTRLDRAKQRSLFQTASERLQVRYYLLLSSASHVHLRLTFM